MDDGKARETSVRPYSWHWPWYRLLLLYLCGMLLGATLAVLLYRLGHAESVVMPGLAVVAMLGATANELRDAWRGRGPDTAPRSHTDP